MSEWKEATIGDLVTRITKGTTPPKGQGFVDKNGVNYIKSDAIEYDGTVDQSKFVLIDEETHEKFKRSQLEEGDILFSMAGNYLGKSGIVTQEMLPANTNQALAIIRLNKELALPQFIGFCFRQPNMIKYVNNMSAQSAQPNINFQEIASLYINLPDIEEQKEIINVLGNLDKKITLLRQQNKDLEELAQTLFKRWFVEFEFPNENGEPYKSSGGKMDESELGEIPEGWRLMSLSSIATYLNGLACQKYPVISEDKKLPVLKIKELGSGISDNSDWATSEVDNKYIIRSGYVIFSWSGTLMLKIWDGEDCVLNQHLFKVTSDEFPKWLIYQWTGFHLRHFIAVAQSKATTMGHIKRSHLDEAMCIIPSIEVLNKFNPSFNAQLELYINNNKEIQTLTQLRDTLLPRLMSGEIRVNPN
ncbi:restriction endonuclease subunit S [Plebeiibacterium marinum]|uniref:Restriction endonuclease subunit S n=1 Tax=Plebeiibacterium marinum TaxID=2992111 RepID=A0AAE3MEN9_9BACT|nr:restriction endonuclease subunit S [Plebeiobacterium marinum]MCW3805667.1 restriction endonuclease subunit S [Plebeiobacterium marinum]